MYDAVRYICWVKCVQMYDAVWSNCTKLCGSADTTAYTNVTPFDITILTSQLDLHTTLNDHLCNTLLSVLLSAREGYTDLTDVICQPHDYIEHLSQSCQCDTSHGTWHGMFV